MKYHKTVNVSVTRLVDILHTRVDASNTHAGNDWNAMIGRSITNLKFTTYPVVSAGFRNVEAPFFNHIYLILVHLIYIVSIKL